MMRGRLLLVTALTTLALPTAALAVQTRMFEFSEGRINTQWLGQGQITMQKNDAGIVLQSTNGTGMLITTLDGAFQPQSGVIRAMAPEPAKFYFGWVHADDPEQATFMIPLSLMTGAPEEKDFSLRDDSTWGPGTKRIAVILPPNTTMLLTQLTLQRWNVFEQTLEALRSFWVFDEQRPYSINFVWGPQIGWNPSERNHLYDLLPPVYQSGTLTVLTIVIVLIAVLLCIGIWRKTSKDNIVRWIAVLLLAVWILFDVRMGSEFLSWVVRDYQTYGSKEPGAREFRDRGTFYDFAEFAAPLVADRASYLFFAERPWPYLGAMRYLTYPSIPGIDQNDDTWVVFGRSDLGVNAEGRLTVDGEAATPAGTVLGRFNDDSFVFRVTP